MSLGKQLIKHYSRSTSTIQPVNAHFLKEQHLIDAFFQATVKNPP